MNLNAKVANQSSRHYSAQSNDFFHATNQNLISISIPVNLVDISSVTIFSNVCDDVLFPSEDFD